MKKAFKKKIEELRNYFGIPDNFDIIEKNITIGKKETYMLMIDGFMKDMLTSTIINRLFNAKDKIKNISDIIKTISYVETEVTSDIKRCEQRLLSGAVLLFVEEEEQVIVIDTREYPVRAVSEPELEKVTRGARDGFVETLVFNTALIRRRLRDNRLRLVINTIGSLSKTDIVLAYIDGVAKEEFINEIKDKLSAIDTDSLTMGEKTLIELLIPKQWYNPLPKVRFTERPDVACAHLLEGHVLLLIDNSPSVIILPTTIFHFIQHPEDYYQHPLVGNYIRFLRLGAMIISYLLIPLWYLLIVKSDLLPEYFKFIIPNNDSNISFFFQLLFLEFGIDLLKMSSMHTPSSLTTSMSIIGGLIIGDLAINTGWLSPEAILAAAVVSICTFATPSQELAMGIRIFRLFLFIVTAIFLLPGFIIGNIVVFIVLLTTKNNSKTSYLYPLIPFDAKKLKNIFIRFPFHNK